MRLLLALFLVLSGVVTAPAVTVSPNAGAGQSPLAGIALAPKEPTGQLALRRGHTVLLLTQPAKADWMSMARVHKERMSCFFCFVMAPKMGGLRAVVLVRVPAAWRRSGAWPYRMARWQRSLRPPTRPQSTALTAPLPGSFLLLASALAGLLLLGSERRRERILAPILGDIRTTSRIAIGRTTNSTG